MKKIAISVIFLLILIQASVALKVISPYGTSVQQGGTSSALWTCPDGYATQNMTEGGVQCVEISTNGSNQTPWTSDINANLFELYNIDIIKDENNQTYFDNTRRYYDDVGAAVFMLKNGIINTQYEYPVLDVNGRAFYDENSAVEMQITASGMRFGESYTLPKVDGNEFDVLQTNGGGTVSWQPVADTSGFVPYTGADQDLIYQSHNIYNVGTGLGVGGLTVGTGGIGEGQTHIGIGLDDGNHEGNVWKQFLGVRYNDSKIVLYSHNGEFSNTSIMTMAYDEGATYNLPFTFSGRVRAMGSVSEEPTGSPRLDIGVQAGTPRMIFEPTSGETWEVDNSAGTFRLFTPGVVQFSIDPAATPSQGSYSTFSGNYPVALDTENGLSVLGRDTYNTRNAFILGKAQIGYSAVGITEQRGYAVLDLNTSGPRGLNLMDSTYGGLLLGYTGATIQGRTTVDGNSQTLTLQPFGGNLVVGPGGGSMTSTFNGEGQFIGSGTSSHINYLGDGSEDTYIRGGKTGARVSINDNHNGNVLIAGGGGLVGVGTTPSAELHVVDTAEQFIVGYDGSNSLNINVSSSGQVVYDAHGASQSHIFKDSVTPVGRLMIPMGEVGYFNMTGTNVVISGTSDGSTNMVPVLIGTNFTGGAYEFDNGGANNGSLRYTGVTTKMFHVVGTISYAPTEANDVFVIGLAKNGAVDQDCKILKKMVTAGDIAPAAVHCMMELATNDRIGLYVGNTVDAGDFTVNTLNIFAMGS